MGSELRKKRSAAPVASRNCDPAAGLTGASPLITDAPMGRLKSTVRDLLPESVVAAY